MAIRASYTIVRAIELVKREAHALTSEGRGKILAVLVLSTFLGVGVQMIYPILLPDLRAAYGLDHTLAGLLLSVLWASFALCQLPGGYLADRFGERATLTSSTCAAAITIIVVVTSRSIVLLYIATALVGATIAGNVMGRYEALAEHYAEELGAANGTILAAADGGQAVLPPIASMLAAAGAWQLGFGFTVPLFLLVAVLLWLWLPSDGPTESVAVSASPATTATRATGHQRTVATAKAVLGTMRNPRIRYGTVVLYLYMNIWILFTGFYPTYLIEVKGLSSTAASTLFGLFFATGVAVKPIAGRLYDAIGATRVFPALVGIPGLTLAALPLIDGFAPLLVATVAIAPVLGSGVVVMAHLLEAFPESVRSTAFGSARTFTILAGGGSPVVFGLFVDRGLFSEGMALIGVIALAIIPLSVLIART